MNSGARTLVVARSPYLAHNAATCLWQAGHRVDVMGTWGWSPYRLSRAIRRYIRIDDALLPRYDVVDGLVGRIDHYCRRARIDVVVPADVSANLSILFHRDQLRSARLFPSPSYDQFLQMHDKWLFSKVSREAGSRHPATRLVEDVACVVSLDLPFPVMVKPLRRTFGEGIVRVTTPEELRQLIQGYAVRNELPVIAQEWIDGSDIDLTIIADHGKTLAWAVQRRRAKDPCIEFIRDDAVVEIGERILRHTAYHGVADFDLRIDGREQVPVMIECNPRLPGSLCYKLWAGVNFPQVGVAMALGKSLPAFTNPQGFCTDYGVSPKRLAKSLFSGRVVPREFSEYSRVAWRMNYQDPLPHIANWIWSQVTGIERPVTPGQVPASDLA